MHSKESCQQSILAIKDTLDVVGGKWKLLIITLLVSGKRRFGELVRESGVTPRILSKELREMEMNGLLTRTVRDTKPITVEYELTPYSKTLTELLEAMDKWGQRHRRKIMHASSTVT